ncbi:hypothetical protein AAZX31_07G204100 [Glycine max]
MVSPDMETYKAQLKYKCEIKHPIWRLTCYYGFPERDRRKESWNLLCDLANDTSFPWLTFGDFNDLLSDDEKIGLIDHPMWLIRGFRETLNDCNLYDLPMKGYQFTWNRSRGENDGIKEKLDRGAATLDWIDLFPNFKILNGLSPKYDHSPITMKLNDVKRRHFQKHIRSENAWFLEIELNGVVMEV